MNQIFSAFANEIRLKILACLDKNEKTVSELIKICGLSQSAVSQHLMKLKSLKLLKERKEGRFIYYSLTQPSLARLSKELLKVSQNIKI